MKLTKKQFIQILTENAGLYNRTARAIEKQYGIELTRQAVRERAMKYPEILKEIQEENVDIAEEGLHSLMRSKNEPVRFRAIELYLKTRGRSRGYVTESNLKIDFDQMSDDALQAIMDQLISKLK
jgi:hypothetical protein